MLTIFLWRFSHCKLCFLYALKAAWGYLTMQELPSAGQAENGLCPQFITTPLWLNLEMDLSKGDGATASWACLRDRSMCILFQLTLEKEGKNCRGADEFGDPWCWSIDFKIDGKIVIFLPGNYTLIFILSSDKKRMLEWQNPCCWERKAKCLQISVSR